MRTPAEAYTKEPKLFIKKTGRKMQPFYKQIMHQSSISSNVHKPHTPYRYTQGTPRISICFPPRQAELIIPDYIFGLSSPGSLIGQICLFGYLNTTSGTEHTLDVTVDSELAGGQGTNLRNVLVYLKVHEYIKGCLP